MNVTTNENETITIFNRAYFYQQFQRKLYSHQHISRPTHQPRKTLSYLQIIEICSLCFILIEHTIIFILALRKKIPKITLFDAK